MSCVLRVFGAQEGEDFDVDAYLADAPFTPCAVFRRGQPRFKSRGLGGRRVLADHSWINILLSEADGDHVPVQVTDAIQFLTQWKSELQRLRSFPGVKSMQLDFYWWFPYRRTVAQFNLFPTELLALCVETGIEVEVSVYATNHVSMPKEGRKRVRSRAVRAARARRHAERAGE